MDIEKGLVQVFFGNGKGKTTSALGTALRACGSGFKVHLVQFLKKGAGDPEIELPGEIIALQKFSNFSFKRFGAGMWYIAKNKESVKAHKKAAEEALTYLSSCFKKDYNIIIADEILYAVQFSLIKEKDIIALINKKPMHKELILTGSHNPLPKIFELADLVTEIKKIKHPYDKGIIARKGIEY